MAQDDGIIFIQTDPLVYKLLFPQEKDPDRTKYAINRLHKWQRRFSEHLSSQVSKLELISKKDYLYELREF